MLPLSSDLTPLSRPRVAALKTPEVCCLAARGANSNPRCRRETEQPKLLAEGKQASQRSVWTDHENPNSAGCSPAEGGLARGPFDGRLSFGLPSPPIVFRLLSMVHPLQERFVPHSYSILNALPVSRSARAPLPGCGRRSRLFHRFFPRLRLESQAPGSGPPSHARDPLLRRRPLILTCYGQPATPLPEHLTLPTGGRKIDNFWRIASHPLH